MSKIGKEIVKGLKDVLTQAKGVPADRVTVYHVISQWYWRNVSKGRKVGWQGEGHPSRAHTSEQACIHGSAVLPVYRQERNGTYTLLRKALLSRAAVKARSK